jgi:hypothetical protein
MVSAVLLDGFCKAPAVLEVEDKINLEPGLAVAFEIKTGTRRMLPDTGY